MARPGVLGSVVIPAHDEAAVIGRCLDALFDGMRADELDVVVACNGCSDGTADVVRSSGHPVRVLEPPAPSKPNALRAAKEIVESFPRIFLDADVVLPADSARLVLERLKKDGALAARPPIRYDAVRSSLVVRSYYRARARVPAVMRSLWGAGMYGLSEAGRSRFGAYPEVVADDLYVDQQFEPGEIDIVPCAPVVVTAPRRTGDLIRILRRTYRGKAENRSREKSARPPRETTSSTLRDLGRLALTGPAPALDASVYAALATFARLARRASEPPRWERDDSSRVG
jgi:glycosyltransferase involved in cell wall biosynthesis